MTGVSRAAGGAIRIGDFVVDPRSGELQGKAGRQVLSAQPLQLLLALAERPGEVVTREELSARLWPADTFVDFEHGLNAAVKRLRDALGDVAEAPSYVETVPRRGYRLIAEVAASNAAAGDDGRVPAPGPSPRPYRIAPLVLTILTLLAAGALAYVFHGRSTEEPLDASGSGAHLTRFTFGPGLQTDASWSPDGRRIAFAADREGNFDLFLQALDGTEPVRLTASPANETQPAWSPDGQRLVFRSDEGDGGLFTVNVNGGPVRLVASQGFRPVWMPDGRDILFADARLQRLYLVRADGGEPPRETLKGQLTDGLWSSFTVHPDGRIGLWGVHPVMRFGFFVSSDDRRVLRAASAGTKLPDTWRVCPPGRAHWSKAGDAVFVETMAEGLPAIWRVPVDPDTQVWGTPVRLGTGPAGAVQSAVSPDGSRLAFTLIQGTTRAWIFPFDADRGTPPGPGRAVTDEDASIGGLSLTADGSSLFFYEERAGRTSTRGVRMNLDTGDTTVLVDEVATLLTPSRTGSGVAYGLERVPAGRPSTEAQHALAWRDTNGRERLLSTWADAYLVPTDVRRDESALLGSTKHPIYAGPTGLVEWPLGLSAAAAPDHVLLSASRKEFWQGRYSPDGRWVSFVVVDLDDFSRLEIGVAPADSRNATTWTRIAADHVWPDKPRWSPDGRTLYFLSLTARGFFELWGVRFDPARGAPVGTPFHVAAFDSPGRHIDTSYNSEMGVGKGRLALPMRTEKGSIWLLGIVGT